MIDDKYKDMLDMPHHVSLNRKQMPQYDRAAQFAPFAALTGYGEAINETGRIVEKKKILTDDEEDKIGQQLYYLSEHVKENIEVTIIHFVPDKKKDGGSYKSSKGIIKKIDEYDLSITFTDKSNVKFDNILSISSRVFNDYDCYEC